MIQKDSRPIPGWAIVIFLLVTPLILVPGIRLMSDRSMLAMLTLFFGASLVALVVAVLPMGRSALPALGFRRAGWRPIVLGTLGGLVVSVAVTRIGIEPDGIKQAMKVAREPALLVASLAVMAGFAPLVEELVFRGLLYGWVAGHWGSLAAWIVSSLAFAAAHGELAHVILVLPLGLWFGWLRRRTDSLWPSLVAHMANNGLAVAAAALLDV
ncbi:MAG: lysostaphin resistance A-like protein [Solimonas sp.]